MLEVEAPSSKCRSSGSYKIMSNADSSRNYEKRREHDHQSKNHSHHRRRHSTVQEGTSSKKRSIERSTSSSSNSRPHPRAEARDKLVSSNSFDHTPSRSVDRKRRARNEEVDTSEDVWTEHKSSSGKIYYYNKRLDKSQWEKPEKGILKRSKPDKHTPSKSASKPHSVKKEHYHHSDHHTLSNVRHSYLDVHKKSSHTAAAISSASFQGTSFSGSSPSTPISNHSVLSPPTGGGPLTPSIQVGSSINKKLAHSQYISSAPESPLMASSQHATPSLFGSVGTPHPVTPVAPILNYNTKGVVIAGGAPPLTPGMDLSGTSLPIQHPIVQYATQVYTSSPGPTPLHVIPPNTSSAVVNNFQYHQSLTSSNLYTDSSFITTQAFQSPMSKLGRWVGGVVPSELKFPDPESLPNLPHMPNVGNEMFSKVLAERMWTGQFEGIQKQVDHAKLEALSRLTVDHSYHCGQLAKSLLSLECSRIKEVSRSFRLSDLKDIKEAIEKR